VQQTFVLQYNLLGLYHTLQSSVVTLKQRIYLELGAKLGNASCTTLFPDLLQQSCILSAQFRAHLDGELTGH